MLRRRFGTEFLLALSVATSAMLAPPAAQAAGSSAALNAACKRWEDRPAFVSDGRTVKMSCQWAQRSFERQAGGDNLVVRYRALMAAAGTIEGLRTVPGRPPDLICDAGGARPAGGGQVLECSSDFDGQIAPFVFYADADGRLRRIEISVDYRRAYLAGLERAVRRKSISEYFPDYADFQTAIQFAALRSAAGPGDAVSEHDGTLSITVAAPARASGEQERPAAQ